MEKLFREVRCVSIEKNDVKFIPENLVKKPGYLDKHGLMVQELPERVTEAKEPIHVVPVEVAKEESVVEVNKEETKEKATKSTGKSKVDA